VTKGNWATYTSYANVEKTVTLFAGQGMEAGFVDFSNLVGGEVTITIRLNEGWRFADVKENVKIQGYASPPTGKKPSPGKFAGKGHADTSPYEIDVADFAFYGVHVDVEREDCPCILTGTWYDNIDNYTYVLNQSGTLITGTLTIDTEYVYCTFNITGTYNDPHLSLYMTLSEGECFTPATFEGTVTDCSIADGIMTWIDEGAVPTSLCKGAPCVSP
jgi:hypothetical protein